VREVEPSVAIRGPASEKAEAKEDAPELLSDEAVDEEVDGRVDRQQHVRDGIDEAIGDVDIEFNRRHPLPQSYDQPKTDVRQFADDEDAHDDDQGQGDVLALSAAAAEVAMATAHLAQRPNELEVEGEQGDEGTDGAEHEETDRFIDEKVEDPDASHASLWRRIDEPFIGRQFLNAHTFHHQRDIVDDGEDDDEGDCTTCSLDGAYLALERVTDGDVAINGDEKDHPHGGHLSHGSQRPYVRLKKCKQLAGVDAQPIGDVPGGLKGLDKETGEEVDHVDHRQRLKQPVRRALLVVVAPEDGYR